MEYSVVTTVFNDETEIIKLIRNMEIQTSLPCEMVIVDGGSQDNTVKKVIAYSGQCEFPIKILYGERRNISQGFNCAIKEAACAYVGIVACGNRYQENYFEKLIEGLEDSKLQYAYGIFIGDMENASAFSRLYCDAFLNCNQGLEIQIASNHGVLIDKGIIERAGYFYENFVYAGEDLELYEKIYKSGYRGAMVREAISYWETPQDFHEYRKQVKNYTIGKLQIYGVMKTIIRSRKNAAIKSLWAAGFVLCFIPDVSGLGYLGVAAGLSIYFSGVVRRGVKSAFLVAFNEILTWYYAVRECRYASKKYRVNDTNRIRKI